MSRSGRSVTRLGQVRNGHVLITWGNGVEAAARRGDYLIARSPACLPAWQSIIAAGGDQIICFVEDHVGGY